jgi:N utilization substance protein B
MLFGTEFHKETEFPAQDDIYIDNLETEISDEDRAYVCQKVSATRGKIKEIDTMICQKAKGWSIDRIGRVELTILRLSIYEILFDDDIPVSVSINEAVELAKKFGGDDAPSFVNGILSKFAD